MGLIAKNYMSYYSYRRLGDTRGGAGGQSMPPRPVKRGGAAERRHLLEDRDYELYHSF